LFQEKLKAVKSAMSKSVRKMGINNNGDNANVDGWEGFDDEVELNDIDGDGDAGNGEIVDFTQIESCAQVSMLTDVFLRH
jgi:hypothetical protein